jgi:hypothetical protein
MAHSGAHATNLPFATLAQDDAQPGCAFGGWLFLNETDRGWRRFSVF